MNSSPTYTGFSPDFIPYQRKVCDLVRDFDYSQANLEILLSGSYGSAKSTLMAHLIVNHVVKFPGSRVCIARRALPDLKRTLLREILDHISEDFIEGEFYRYNRADNIIYFRNGSEIITATWADKLYKKFRSLKISFLAIEEIVENNEEDQEAFKQLKARLRRIQHIKENILIAATNPDAPSHWVYKYFIEPNSNGSKHPNRFVFYSRTEDNPFLDRTYVNQLRQDLSPKEAMRYLDGLWIELAGEVIYYEYNSERQYLKTVQYTINPEYPIWLTFDFNIGEGKPMSAIMFQFIGGVFHFFNECVIHGARTANVIDEWDSKGLLKKEFTYILTGDASGKHRDTRSSRSDYEIITQEMSNRNLRLIYNVPLSNPPIRTRHNRVNAYCKNDLGQTRLFIYSNCSKADEGMRLTKLKDGGNYIEDDSKDFQHITTAIGYGILSCIAKETSKPSGTVQL